MCKFKLSLLLILCFGLLLSPVYSSDYSNIRGEWNVIDGVLTNGTDTGELEWGYDRKYGKLYHVVPDAFVFVYSNRNTTRYEGDANLEYCTFTDTLTGCEYRLSADLTRGIAYTTHSKFDLKDGFNITRWRELYDTYYTVHDDEIILNNGTEIHSLTVEDDLTPEQKKYFHDYENQLYKHYEDKKIEEMKKNEYWNAKMESEIAVQNRMNSKQKNSKFYGYSSRGGFIYGHSY